MARNVLCSSDVLSELLVSVDLDIYINRTTSAFKAKDQGKESTCYAFASATVLHLAMQRFHGREEGCPSFDELKDEMIDDYGKSALILGQFWRKCAGNMIYNYAAAKSPSRKRRKLSSRNVPL